MSKRDDILLAAEAEFERHGFHAVPIDRVISTARVSPRTLYSHFPSKEALVLSVLHERHRRFIAQLEKAAFESSDPVDGIWQALEDWLSRSKSTGCLFLRAIGEFDAEPVGTRVTQHKLEVLEMLRRFTDRPESLSLLIEGATASAPIVGAAEAVKMARAYWQEQAR